MCGYRSPSYRTDHNTRIDLAAIDTHRAAEAADIEGRLEVRVSREARRNRFEIRDLPGRAAAGHSEVLLVGSGAGAAGFMRIERCASILASALELPGVGGAMQKSPAVAGLR
jgi:hypothetical protein